MYLYHVIDTETTGFNALEDEICEIAILTCEGINIVDVYHSFFDVSKMSQGAQNAHGLTRQMLSGWPHLKDVVHEVRPRIKHKIFAHNAQFDARFLCSAGLICGNHPIKDTLVLCRNGNLKLENNKLSTWLQYYGFPHQNHNALSDAFGLFRLITFKGWQVTQ